MLASVSFIILVNAKILSFCIPIFFLIMRLSLLEKDNDLIKKLKNISSNSINKCRNYLYSWEKSKELLETATYINLQFENLYKELNKN